MRKYDRRWKQTTPDLSPAQQAITRAKAAAPKEELFLNNGPRSRLTVTKINSLHAKRHVTATTMGPMASIRKAASKTHVGKSVRTKGIEEMPPSSNESDVTKSPFQMTRKEGNSKSGKKQGNHGSIKEIPLSNDETGDDLESTTGLHGVIPSEDDQSEYTIDLNLAVTPQRIEWKALSPPKSDPDGQDVDRPY